MKKILSLLVLIGLFGCQNGDSSKISSSEDSSIISVSLESPISSPTSEEVAEVESSEMLEFNSTLKILDNLSKIGNNYTITEIINAKMWTDDIEEDLIDVVKVADGKAISVSEENAVEVVGEYDFATYLDLDESDDIALLTELITDTSTIIPSLTGALIFEQTFNTEITGAEGKSKIDLLNFLFSGEILPLSKFPTTNCFGEGSEDMVFLNVMEVENGFDIMSLNMIIKPTEAMEEKGLKAGTVIDNGVKFEIRDIGTTTI